MVILCPQSIHFSPSLQLKLCDIARVVKQTPTYVYFNMILIVEF